LTDDDPFGRRGDEETDAFGRPIAKGSERAEESEQSQTSWAPPGSGSLWSGQAEREGATDAPAATPSGRFLPPTEVPSESRSNDAAATAFGTTSVSADAEKADYMARVGAAVIDFFIRAGIAIGVLIVVAIATGGGDDASAIALLLGYYAIAPLYAPLAMTRWEGQTVGHRAVNTRIVGRKGEPVTGGRAFVREVGAKYLLVEVIGGGLTLGIFTLVNYLWPLWDKNDEALHDKMCDTRVVKA
jgi:uncharacterized RDD family membrane protein YckC